MQTRRKAHESEMGDREQICNNHFFIKNKEKKQKNREEEI